MKKAAKISAVIMAIIMLFGAVGSTVAYVVTKTPSLINTFRPTVDPTSDLIITKKVEHPYGAGYVIPDDLTFGFLVELGASYALSALKTSTGELTADESGNITISLKHGESFGINELEPGTVVTVSETSQKNGFYADQAVRTATVEPDSNVRFDFVNTYKPQNAQNVITLTGEKILKGRDWQENDKFTVQLERKSGDAWTVLGTKDIIYDAENAEFNKFDFNDIISAVAFDNIGTYSFRISEIAGEIEGILYDSVMSYFDVKITDNDMDGYLEISEVTSTNNAKVTDKNVHVTFTNTYAPEGSAEFKVNITKSLIDKSAQDKQPEGFTFEVTDGTDTYVSEPTSAAGETAVTLSFNGADAGKSFTYSVKEVNTGLKGYIYDDSEYVFVVDVIDNFDGTVKAVLKDTEETSCGLKFENTYDPEDAKITLGGNKTLTGRELNEGEFTFVLSKGEETVQTTKNNSDGSFAFEELTFDKVGVYEYVITEDSSGPLGGVTYDESEYFVRITVTDEDGELKAEKNVTGKDGEAAEISFTNAYKAQKAVLSLGGIKKLRGTALKDGMFSFYIYQTNSNYEISTAALDEAINMANGTFTFDNLSFENVGTYYFVIKEDTQTPIDRMQYDTSVYAVKVDIIDSLDGKLVSETTIEKVGGNVVDTVVFENIYTPKPEDLTIEVDIIKTVKNTGNRDLGPEGFEFVLEEISGGERFTAVSDEKGNAGIVLTYTEDDTGKTYTYKLTEKQGSVEGVTYSTQEYEFSVTITLNDDNQLVATVTSGEESLETLEFAFENEYYKYVEPSSPGTGDDTMFMLYFGILWTFLMAAVVVGRKRRGMR